VSNYIKATDFAVKDGLLTGNPNKIIKGTEIDDEYNAIAVAVQTKADLVSPTFTGTPAAPTAAGGTNTTQIATTAFANAAVTAGVTAGVTAERTATATLTNKTLTSPTINGGTISGITDLTVADGGTGVSSLTADNVILGDGTNPVKFVAPGTSGNVLTSNGTTWTSAAIPNQITTATEQATTSGFNIDFTGIPAGVKRITVLFNGVSHDGGGGGGSTMIVQLGDSGGIETTGYVAASMTDSGNISSTAGFIMRDTSGGSSNVSGLMTIINISGNTWVSSHSVTRNTSACAAGAGTKTLSDPLTQIRLTTSGGSATFDEGSINILYE
jgi:hypothetical protein